MAEGENVKLNPVVPPVSEALILICEKCGKKLARDSEENPSRALQSELKGKIKALDGKGKLRAVVTSCMDICPEGEIAIGISPSESRGGKDRFFTVKEGDPEKMANTILEQATRRQD
jgi:hypothetical protein